MVKVVGVLMVVLALVLAIVPGFTDCESQGKVLTTAQGKAVSMKCHWTGRAEIAAAIPLGLAGVFAVAGRRRETKRFAAVVGAASGILAILFATTLIGTCASASMYCNVAMKPVILAAGILAIAVSAVLFVLAREEPSTAA
ncbi:MAG TPA: DUF4418 family protein [Anaerolineae bacterium]|nr:DUF4418 family protein [Anaerolineae bacterium]